MALKKDRLPAASDTLVLKGVRVGSGITPTTIVEVDKEHYRGDDIDPDDWRERLVALRLAQEALNREFSWPVQRKRMLKELRALERMIDKSCPGVTVRSVVAP